MAKATASAPQTTPNETATVAAEKDGGGNVYVKGLNNLLFNQLPKGASFMLCGQLKGIVIKNTPYGDVEGFKGDFILHSGENTRERSQTAYLPGSVKEAIKTAAAKLGKWSVVEFRLTATKADNMIDYSVKFEVGPRLLAGESDRVLALVSAK